MDYTIKKGDALQKCLSPNDNVFYNPKSNNTIDNHNNKSHNSIFIGV